MPIRRTATGTADIKLLDLASGAVTQLTHCQTAMCTSPVWRPDGQMIAYERAENDPQFGNSPARIWLLDLTGVRRRSVAGSLIGGIRETQEMLDFCAEHGLASDIEVIAPSQINEAYARLEKSDVRYRFVIDMAQL